MYKALAQLVNNEASLCLIKNISAPRMGLYSMIENSLSSYTKICNVNLNYVKDNPNSNLTKKASGVLELTTMNKRKFNLFWQALDGIEKMTAEDWLRGKGTHRGFLDQVAKEVCPKDSETLSPFGNLSGPQGKPAFR